MLTIQKQKMHFFEKTLIDFFKKVGREHLPWRRDRITAYEVWVSEIMLQQTQVSRVIDYYNRFLKRYPTIGVLARSDWETFLPYYEGLGYYARGRNMLHAAKIIVADFHGKFPREKKLLETIPGIGPYTASAILSFAYDENHLAWDTNLKRVIGRFFFGSRRAEFDTEEMASRFSLPAKSLNAALMDFGSALCLSRPKCAACPLRTRCAYFSENGNQETVNKEQSTKKKKEKAEKIDWKEARAFVFLHENHRKYFSSHRKKYAPFTLPKVYNSRAGIKLWFQKEYGLTVSVRPPHRKLMMRNQPVFFVNAQILSGRQSFVVFSKKDFQISRENLIKK